MSKRAASGGPVETGVIMQAESVRAILAGAKTQSRRVAKLSPEIKRAIAEGGRVEIGAGGLGRVWRPLPAAEFSFPIRCPYGGPGDRLWVRETWCALNACPTSCPRYAWEEGCADHRRVVFRADPEADGQLAGYLKPDDPDDAPAVWGSPIHLRRVDARIVLKLEEVRLEPVRSISEADALAEGIPRTSAEAIALGLIAGGPPAIYNDPIVKGLDLSPAGVWDMRDPVANFAGLWERLNGTRDEGAHSWTRNPYVWALRWGAA